MSDEALSPARVIFMAGAEKARLPEFHTEADVTKELPFTFSVFSVLVCFCTRRRRQNPFLHLKMVMRVFSGVQCCTEVANGGSDAGLIWV